MSPRVRRAIVATVGLGVLAAGFATGADAGDRLPTTPSNGGGVVFLSHVNTPDMPIFPGDPAPVFEQTYSVTPDGFALQTVTIGDHSGTHWGAPCHFNEGEACAESMAADDFVHPAAIIDIRAQVAVDPDYAMSVADIKRYERRHGKIRPDAMVIAWTGWDQYWNDPDAYFNEDADGIMHYPGISGEATEWLIANRDIGGLGIDTHGVDPGSDTSYLTNTLLLQEDRIHLENLTGLGQMPAKGGWVVVGGVRNLGGSGSPATVLGFTR